MSRIDRLRFMAHKAEYDDLLVPRFSHKNIKKKLQKCMIVWVDDNAWSSPHKYFEMNFIQLVQLLKMNKHVAIFN